MPDDQADSTPANTKPSKSTQSLSTEERRAAFVSAYAAIMHRSSHAEAEKRARECVKALEAFVADGN